jgi:starvation-inducible outer membrane lipoprotein
MLTQGIAAVLIALALAGCTSAPAVIRALARDPAGSCASIATVYGTVVVGRGPAAAGGEVVVQGGSCAIRQGGRTP